MCSEWFKSYLTNRKQTVTGGSSNPLRMTHGVAQGSILGPILFLILINDLSCFLTHGRLPSYADDTQLLDHSPPTTIGPSQLRSHVEQSILDFQLCFQSFQTNILKDEPEENFHNSRWNPAVSQKSGIISCHIILAKHTSEQNRQNYGCTARPASDVGLADIHDGASLQLYPSQGCNL